MPENDVSKVKDWARYYAATDSRPPRPTLLRALDAFGDAPPGEGLAVDLGCGAGRDTLPILARGWRVIAVDAEPMGLARLRARAADLAARLQTVEADLASYDLPSADLVNASFVLFFLARPELEGLWARLRTSLRPGGRFAGQLLAPRDSWAARGECIGHDRDQLAPLLDGFAVETLEEEENDGITPQGEAKHWHLWHLNLARVDG